jgi:solute carrier family 32 (vesicular inhibitory amino acid transporter)
MNDQEGIINNELSSSNQLKGLTIFTAAIFIIGEMSGTGVLSLPISIDQSGWTGLAMVLICCVLSGYCGFRLSSCWTMLLEKNEELREGVRDPFPVIAYEAAGKLGRRIVEVAVYIQLFGVSVIFLLIAAANIHSLLSNIVIQFCDWTIIIAILMCPVSMLGTPKDFWPIAVGAAIFTAIACLFIFIQTMRQSIHSSNHPSEVTFKSFFISFGTILFCFGGAAMFPSTLMRIFLNNNLHLSNLIFIKKLFNLI